MQRLAAYWQRCDAPGRGLDWVGLAIFLIVACAWSTLAARLGPLRLPGDLPRIDPMVLIGFGPLLGAMAAGLVRRTMPNWPAGFRGLARRWSTIALVLPIVVAALAGIARFHLDPHLDAAMIAASLVIGCAAEEAGWREWLYNALAGLPLWASALLTWGFWLAWQLSFAATAAESFGATLAPAMILGLLVASFVLAAIVRQTRSAGIAAAWRVAAAAEIMPWQTILLAVLLGFVTWQAAKTTDQALRRMSR